MRLLLACLALALAAPAAAQTTDDFAWQWPIQADDQASAHLLVLDAEVLQYVQRADLGDLAVFNADGKPVPFAHLPPQGEDFVLRDPVPWLRVPLPEPGQGEDLSLRLERYADGRLRGLELQASEQQTAPTGRHDLLLDRGEDPDAASTLHVQLGYEARLPVNLRVSVSGSDDLIGWRRLGHGLPLIALDDNGLRIERLRLDFERSDARYLRLSIENEGNWPQIDRLEIERRVRSGDERPWLSLELQGEPVPGEPGAFRYTSPAPVLVERVDLRLADANSVAAVQINARDTGQEWWGMAAGFTAFRLGQGANEVRHLAPDTYARRDREWQVSTQPALASAPTLVLQYRPEHFVLLAQGPAPYTLVAGSTRVARPNYPVHTALAASGEQPAPATLGARSEAGGEAALAPRRGEDWQRWLLWAVLAIGAGLVLWMSARVLKNADNGH